MHQITQPFSSPRELSLNVNNMRFAAQEWGEPNGFPVLALHGWLDNSSSFFALAPRLQNLHIVAIDFAGHGKSQHRPGVMPYTLWDDINDVLAIADSFGWRKFAFLGHSRGAIISTLAAGTFPERIICMGLIEGFLPDAAPAEDAPHQLARAIAALRSRHQKTASIYPDIAVAIKARERGMFPVGYEAAKALTERGLVPNGGGFSWGIDRRLLLPSAIRMSREQLAAFANNIRAPVKLLLGVEGLPKLYENYLQELSRFPHINYELLEGGHHLHMEREVEQVAVKLNTFFAQFITTK